MSEYIDRHRAVEALRSFLNRNPFACHPRDEFINQGVHHAWSIIERMPTADVAEIRRGHWSDISGQACLCSVCGRPQNYKQARGWRYCPHCGAVME